MPIMQLLRVLSPPLGRLCRGSGQAAILHSYGREGPALPTATELAHEPVYSARVVRKGGFVNCLACAQAVGIFVGLQSHPEGLGRDVQMT